MEDLKSREEERTENVVTQPVEMNWTESDWFNDWLRLARREYHGRIQAPKKQK
jgi:hypothetical protein